MIGAVARAAIATFVFDKGATWPLYLAFTLLGSALMNRETAYWLCQVGGWGLYFAVSIPLAVTDDEFEPPFLLVTAFILLFAIAITHAYRIFLKRRGWIELPAKRLFPRALLAIIVLSVISSLVASSVQITVRYSFGKDPLDWKMYVISMVGWGFLMLAWSLFYYGIHFFWHMREAEIANWKLKADFREAELRALKAQVEPHFIFNMLNNLRGLIAENPMKAQDMVTRMAKLLRASFQSDKDMLVPLDAELALAENYLQLEAVRLEERLRYEVDVPPETRSLPVPAMLVQTLVENGIKHGISLLPAGGSIRIHADLAPNAENPALLKLIVGNSGRIRKHGEPVTNLCDSDDRLLQADHGIGLANARERLRLHYGPDASLDLRDAAPDWVEAEVNIPLESQYEHFDR